MSVTIVSSCGIQMRMDQVKGKREGEMRKAKDVVWGFHSINYLFFNLTVCK